MATCPHCNHELDAEAVVPAPSNTGRKIMIEVDEDFVPAMVDVFTTMSNRYGMYGHGILANKLIAMSKALDDSMDRRLIGFEAGPWAQALHAHDKGWNMVFLFDKKTRNVVIGGYDGPDDEEGKVFAQGFVRKGDDPQDVLALVEDIFARRTPQPPKPKDAPQTPGM